MARYTGPKQKISRRFGTPIYGASKYLERKPYPPGTHGPRSRRKLTDYALGLNEKQKFRYYYGILEKQFRRAYETAKSSRGVTGEVMLQILETRLDSMVYHLGFANTRRAARQMVSHGHIKVNGRRLDVPSYAVRINDVLEVKDSSVSRRLGSKGMESSTSRPIPGWVTRDKDAFRGVLVRMPTLEEIQPIANEQAVVEFYSR